MILLVDDQLNSYIKIGIADSWDIPEGLISQVAFFTIINNRPFDYKISWKTLDNNTFYQSLPADDVNWLMAYGMPSGLPSGTMKITNATVSDITNIL